MNKSLVLEKGSNDDEQWRLQLYIGHVIRLPIKVNGWQVCFINEWVIVASTQEWFHILPVPLAHRWGTLSRKQDVKGLIPSNYQFLKSRTELQRQVPKSGDHILSVPMAHRSLISSNFQFSKSRTDLQRQVSKCGNYTLPVPLAYRWGTLTCKQEIEGLIPSNCHFLKSRTDLQRQVPKSSDHILPVPMAHRWGTLSRKREVDGLIPIEFIAKFWSAELKRHLKNAQRKDLL